jgi:hypothetical protein
MTPGSGRVAIGAASGRAFRAAARLWSWFKRNVDTSTALVVAAVISVLGQVATVDPRTVNNAILAVLGLLAFAVIRDRGRDEARDELIVGAAEQTSRLLTQMSADLQIVSRTSAQNAEIQLLTDGGALERDLTASRNSTHNWLFRGDTGTYIRAVTLPRIVERARTGAHELYLRLEILDPADAAVCDQYALYRRSQAGSVERWDRRQVEYECYATILACFRHWQSYPRLRPEIGLSRIVRTMRWELFDDALFITQEVPAQPAFKVPSGRLLYECTRTELDLSFDQSRRLELAPARSVRLSTTSRGPTYSEVRRLFSALRLPIPAAYGDADLNNIIGRVLPAQNANR